MLTELGHHSATPSKEYIVTHFAPDYEAMTTEHYDSLKRAPVSSQATSVSTKNTVKFKGGKIHSFQMNK
jgi:hypothetical protein